jgi:hypothetical protein
MPRKKIPLVTFGAERLRDDFLQGFFKTSPQFAKWNSGSHVVTIISVLADPELIHSKSHHPCTPELRKRFCDLVSEAPDFAISFSAHLLRHWNGMKPARKFLIWNPWVLRGEKIIHVNELSDGEIAQEIKRLYSAVVTTDAVKKERQKLASDQPESEAVRDRARDPWGLLWQAFRQVG